jgi:excisionase family DNA binding protein
MLQSSRPEDAMVMAIDDEQLVGVTEAAKVLQVNVNTLRAWSDQGKIPVVRLPSGHRRYQLSELRRALREMGYRTAADPASEAER